MQPHDDQQTFRLGEMFRFYEFNTELNVDAGQLNESNIANIWEQLTDRLLRQSRESHGFFLQKKSDCTVLQNKRKMQRNAAGFFHWLITVVVPCAACKGRGQTETQHLAWKRQVWQKTVAFRKTKE